MTNKLWLWKNFVDGKPEYWAFDNAYPVNLDGGDPQTLGEPCGYALLKPSVKGRSDVSDDEVLKKIAAIAQPVPDGMCLVPIEPTSEMLEAGCPCGEVIDHFDMRAAYRAMLEAHNSAAIVGA